MKTIQIDEKAVFNTSRKISDDAAREEYLELACSGNESVLKRIRALLIVYLEEQEFLESPPPGLDATKMFSDVSEQPGDTIGPYKLLQQIGEGGFGVVYMAEQLHPIRRKVALKIIKPGMDTKEVVARFEAERQALALMDHSNIARVFDGGATESGRPYFVMELVTGLPLTDYCDKNLLPPAERLKLFVDVCNAVQHAHHKGVIHRDLKPSNIMVTLHDGIPVCKVIDFGVSKALNQQLTEKTLFTAYGQMVGTPAYMSPEQAEMSGLDIDTRSDVYSLGVLLYELLTGGTPFETERLRTAGYAEMLRIINEEEPPVPSTRLTTVGQEKETVASNRGTDPAKLGQIVRGELDWITMKALEKDRQRRYKTAASLADDVERFLHDEAVEACPPTLVYRVGKFARRHKATLGAVSMMVFLLLAGIVATSWQAIRATAEKNRSRSAEQLADQRLKESELAREEAEAISTFLNDLLKSPRPKTEGGGQNVRLADLLDEAARRLSNAKGISPERIVGLQNDLANTYFILGLHDKAAKLREKVVAHFLRTKGNQNRLTIEARMNLAVSYYETNKAREAKDILEDVLRLCRKGPVEWNTLAIQATGHLASTQEKLGYTDSAIELRQEALRLSEEKLGRLHITTFHAMNRMARSYLTSGSAVKALELQKEAVSLGFELLPSEHIDLLQSRNLLANCYEVAGQSDEALRIRKALMGKLLEQTKRESSSVLATFDERQLVHDWIVVDDSVMGGRSSGGAELLDGKLVFSGETVTQGGGFSSTRIRETDPIDLSSADSVQIRVKGDGRNYMFEIRTKASVTPWNAIPYRAEFATSADEWIEVSIPFDRFIPTSHGFDISDFAPALEKSDIRSFGLMVNDKKDGKFRIEVDWIKAVSAKDNSSIQSTGSN